LKTGFFFDNPNKTKREKHNLKRKVTPVTNLKVNQRGTKNSKEPVLKQSTPETAKAAEQQENPKKLNLKVEKCNYFKDLFR
jgi:hypothetical protein